MGNIIAGIIVLAVLGFAAFRVFSSIRKGKSGCSCGCEGCSKGCAE
jgi:hypothetical protein